MHLMVCESEFPSHYHFIEHVLPLAVRHCSEVTVLVIGQSDSAGFFAHSLKRFAQHERVSIRRVFRASSIPPHMPGFDEEEADIRRYNANLLIGYMQDQPPDHLLIPSADKLLPYLADFAQNDPAAYSRIRMHLGIHWLSLTSLGSACTDDPAAWTAGAVGAIAEPVQRTKVENLLRIKPATVLVQNRLAARRLASHFGQVLESVVHQPVPLESFAPVGRAEARQRLNLPVEGWLVGMTGSIQARKGVLRFLRGMRAQELGSDDHVMLAGPHEFLLKRELTSEFKDWIADGRLLIRDQVLSANEIHLHISAMDLVVCNLGRHEWSSDIALRALHAERCLLCSEGEWFGDIARTYGAVTFCSPDAGPKEVGAAVQAGLDLAGTYVPCKAIDTSRQFHCPENYATITLSALLEERNVAH